MGEECSLFGEVLPAHREREEIAALDQMVAASRCYHSSREYMETLRRNRW